MIVRLKLNISGGQKMPNIVLTFDCEGAHHDKCYTKEYIKVLEREFVPATWLIHSSLRDPSANTHLYHSEFFHMIPSWHEVGSKINFENERGYIESPKERGDLIRVARDTLCAHNINPTAVRAGSFALLASDITDLEESGFLVDCSIIPDADYKMFVDWKGAPRTPYHSDSSDLKKRGSNKILHVPVLTDNHEYCYLDKGFELVKQMIAAHIHEPVLCLGIRDYYDSVEDLYKIIRYLKGHEADFTTLTQTANKFYEHHKAPFSH